MNRIALATMATFVGASTATAGGLDRSGLNLNYLFETGNYAELSFGYIMPSVDGVENGSTGTSNGIGNVAENFLIAGVAIKADYNDKLSFGISIDEPYGSDVSYPGDPAASALGGTGAIVDSYAMTALARYKFGGGVSVHGGVRYQEISADVTLGGLAYGGLNGYNANFQSSGAFGYVVGAAYERPEIALRVALTYNSKITHDLETRESVGGNPTSVISGGALPDVGTTEVVSPESLNLTFQTGVAKDTLVFGSIRYAKYEQTIVSPAFFASQTGGGSLTSIEDSLDVELGVGRKFSDRLAASLAVGYSRAGDDLVSPLSPTNGNKSIALGASYQVTEAVKLSGGIRYTKLGDAQPATGGTARADFNDNSAVAVGFKIGYSF